MSSAPRVFLSRLANVGVFDPNGDQIGKTREAVATLRVGRQPPQVLGLVVEIQHRHRIFVPMGRVTRLEADAVMLSTASVNLKRFQRRQNEIMVIAELLDRDVTLSADGRPASIVDAGMELTRGQDWLITRLAVRVSGGRLRGRRGEMFQVDWDEVRGLSLTASSESSQGTGTVLSMLAGLRPADVATALKEMPERRRREVAAALDDERLADVIQELSDEDQIALLGSLSDERAADVLEEMDDDDAADLLGDMPAADQERLLTLMEPDEAAPVRRLMSYGDYTAGGLMTSEPVILLPDATVADALALVRNPDLTPALASQVYVVRPPQATPTGRFIGTAHLQRMLREPPSSLVGAVVETDPDPLTPHASLGDVTRYLATYNLVAAPVVDADDRLLGAVSVDDVVDHLLPEDWRDAEPSGVHVTHGGRHG